MHTAELLVPQPGCCKIKNGIEKFKRYKLPDIVQISAELILAGDNPLRSEIHKLINYIWNKEELPL
jgi:hypothetical protein